MSSVSDKLTALKIELPELPGASGAFVPGVVVDPLLFVSGQTWKQGSRQALVGRVGAEVTEAEAIEAARRAVLFCLAEAEAVLGTLDRIERVVRIVGYVRSAPGFDRQPVVIDGASRLLLEVFGTRGQHARASVGVAELPGGAAVEIEAIFEVRKPSQ